MRDDPFTMEPRSKAGRIRRSGDPILRPRDVRWCQLAGSPSKTQAVRFWCSFSVQTPTFMAENSGADARFSYESRLLVVE